VQVIEKKSRARNTGFMQSLGSRLPPLKTLVAFEATARYLSLTRAAQELGISREAVSRQMRVLEEHLGIKLFDRLHRAVALTPAGRKFQAVVQESLENISYVTGTIRRPGQPFRITVSATIAISSFWLTPRLARFRDANPNVEIHVAVSDTLRDLLTDGIDVGLRYGDGNWKGLTAVRLFGVNSFPVCSPDYLESAAHLARPSDLLNHNLINLDGAPHASEDWWWWLKGHDVAVPRSFKTLGFDSYDNVIQAALDGQGVALGFSGLVTNLINKGRLVRPIGEELSKGLAVFLVMPSAVKPTPRVRGFIDWILEEASEETTAAAKS
jgi:LysR family glycine cleavage system transcriptional activator